jgi:serine/threonine protein kinase
MSRTAVHAAGFAAPPTQAESETACLSDSDVAAFAEGKLDIVELPRLHQHLDQCERCQQLVIEAVRASAFALTHPDDGTPVADWNTTFRRGSVIGGRYFIERFIARGGMGEVYEAFDRDLLERVALKTVTSTACDSHSAVRRLKGEVQLARRVSHPNVCRIYDLGTHALDDGVQVHFLTMEFVEGETLGQRIRRAGALPLQEARDIARQLLLGLRAAHGAGILHRDFKSDNVMLRAEADGTTTPVILDFGLARPFDDRTQAPSGSSQHVVGTFGYIAPEHLQGDSLTIASDLYSFGVVCFEMLTGELPLPNQGERAKAIDTSLSALVDGCLQRSPSRRFESTEAALASLEAGEQRARLAKGRRLPGLIALVALCAVVGWLVTKATKSEPFRDASSLGRANISRAKVEVPKAAPELDISAAKTLPEPDAQSPVTEGPSAKPAPSSKVAAAKRPASSPAPVLTPRGTLEPDAPAPDAPAPDAPDAKPEATGPPSDGAAAPPLHQSDPAPPSSAPSPTPSSLPAWKRPDWENPFGNRAQAAPGGPS